jgi:hypothetical protein
MRKIFVDKEITISFDQRNPSSVKSTAHQYYLIIKFFKFEAKIPIWKNTLGKS